ncbi:MAG: efflux RND transporter periplasmic adaptor subunit [Gemmatimonadota bacterium]
MSKTTKRVLATLSVLAVGGAAAAAVLRGDDGRDAVETVTVERGTVTDHALAVGHVEPEVEVDVKSQVSGVVETIHADEGEFVEKGTPLLEIQPNPTPKELVEARRDVEMKQKDVPFHRRDYERTKRLREMGIVSVEDLERAEQDLEQARLELELAREQLALLEEGRVASAAGDVESVMKSPIGGFILEKRTEVGDPVVPLTPSQEGTVLMTMAAMDDLLFRGTVDEIDVGRLEEGMEATIEIGALPEAAIPATVRRISLKARQEENSTVFPVELALEPDEETVLRAGYSANAEIRVAQREDVLVIPERLVTFEGDSARVEVLGPGGEREDRTIETGLSDAVQVEVVSGLEAGEEVVDPEPREIE